MMLNMDIIDNSYITSIETILKLNSNSTYLGCYQNLFNINEQIDCFKSFILTPVLCINYCRLTGTTTGIKIVIESLEKCKIIFKFCYNLHISSFGDN